MVAPIEAFLKKPAGVAKWSAECTVALNEFLVCIFACVRLVLPYPMGIVVIYPLVEGDMCFVAHTQPGPNIEECPIAFLARFLTKIELKYSIFTTLVSVTAWAIKKLHHYTIFTMEVCIVLPTTANIPVVVDLESNIKCRANIFKLQ